MWSSVIAFLSQPTAPYVFCGVIILVFFYALLEGWFRLKAISLAVQRATGVLESAANPEQFYEQFESIGDRLSKETQFANLWSEFSKTVVLDSARLLVRITRRPQEFFNTNSLIAPQINLRLYAVMPGYLISLGLFFTFIGLVAAIAIAANGLAKGSDVTHTQQALVQLLDVASLKFISSVTGIFLSIVLSFVQKSWLNKTTMLIHRFGAAIERRTQLITTEQLLYQWLLAQQQTTRGHSHLAEDIATEVTLQLKQSR